MVAGGHCDSPVIASSHRRSTAICGSRSWVESLALFLGDRLSSWIAIAPEGVRCPTRDVIVVCRASRYTQLTVSWDRSHMTIACIKISWFRRIRFVQPINANAIQPEANQRGMAAQCVVVITGIIPVIVVGHGMPSTCVQHESVFDFGTVTASDLQTVLARRDIHATWASTSSICARFGREANAKSCFFRAKDVHTSTGQANTTPQGSLSRASDSWQALAGARCRVLVGGIAWRIAQSTVPIIVIAAEICSDAAAEDACACIIRQRELVIIVTAIKRTRRPI